jgi:hypothetical protein
MDQILRHRTRDIIVTFNLPMTTLPRSGNPQHAFLQMIGMFFLKGSSQDRGIIRKNH